MFPENTKFLVVDDFATMRKIVKKVLTQLGYKNIEEADDGNTAWPMIKEAHSSGKPYDIIISDWNMPGMTGVDLLKNVRGDANLKEMPFVMVTAESEQKNIVEAVKAGVSDYIVKPFNANTLKTKLESLYTKHNGQAA